MNKRLHRGVERVPADDLMDVWGSDESRVNKGIQTFYDELGAGEAHHG